MANLFVTEFSGVYNGNPQASPGRYLRKNNVAIGAASAPSLAFGANTGYVRLKAEAGCCVVFSATDGVSPTAVSGTNGDMYLVAGDTEYFTTKPGDFLAVIQYP